MGCVCRMLVVRYEMTCGLERRTWILMLECITHSILIEEVSRLISLGCIWITGRRLAWHFVCRTLNKLYFQKVYCGLREVQCLVMLIHWIEAKYDCVCAGRRTHIHMFCVSERQPQPFRACVERISAIGNNSFAECGTIHIESTTNHRTKQFWFNACAQPRIAPLAIKSPRQDIAL